MYACPHMSETPFCTIDNRTSERYHLTVPIVLRHFNQDADIKATLINYSQHGLCLKSQVRFMKSGIVMIRIPGDALICMPKKFEPGFRSMSIAEVRWCNELSPGDTSGFEFGLQYFNV